MALAPLPAAAQEDLSREQIEAIVRDYLLREPEVLAEALQALQTKRAEAQLAAAGEAILANHDELVNSTSPSVGPVDAPVTIVEFFDYRCGFCKRMVPALRDLMERRDDIRVVFKEFPVLGPDSVRGARAALAATLQDPEAYEDMHFALMGAQDLTAAGIAAAAERLGLDADRLAEDMNSDAVRIELERNYALATAIGVEGTPAFVIGDQLLPGAVPMEELEAAIDAAAAG